MSTPLTWRQKKILSSYTYSCSVALNPTLPDADYLVQVEWLDFDPGFWWLTAKSGSAFTMSWENETGPLTPTVIIKIFYNDVDGGCGMDCGCDCSVDGDPFAGDVVWDSTDTDTRSTTTGTYDVDVMVGSGDGTPPYTYGPGTSFDTPWANPNSDGNIQFTAPSTPGTYTIYIKLTDSLGQIADDLPLYLVVS